MISPSVSTAGYISFPKVTSISLFKPVSQCSWKTWLIFRHNTNTLELLWILSKSQISIPAESNILPTQHLQEYFDLMSYSLVQQESISTNSKPGDMSSRLTDRKHPRINNESLQIDCRWEKSGQRINWGLRKKATGKKITKWTSYTDTTCLQLGPYNLKCRKYITTYISNQLMITRQKEERLLPSGKISSTGQQHLATATT